MTAAATLDHRQSVGSRLNGVANLTRILPPITEALYWLQMIFVQANKSNILVTDAQKMEYRQ